MSMLEMSPHSSSSDGHDGKRDGVRTYRARRLEDIIPQIRRELGPDAVILRQREGLTGGVSGFFAQRCYEIDARPGNAPVDLYDDDDDGYEYRPAPAAQNLSASPVYSAGSRRQSEPALTRPAVTTQPPFAARSFANQLAQARTTTTPEVPAQARPEVPPAGASEPTEMHTEAAQADPTPPAASAPPATSAPRPASNPRPESTPRVTSTPRARTTPAHRQKAPLSRRRARPPARSLRSIRRPAVAAPRPKPSPRILDGNLVALGLRELTARGISDAWAQELIAFGAAHRKPFADGNLREAALASIAAALPAAAPLPAAGAAVAIVGAGGAGKTRCAAALAAAYGRGSTLPVTVLALGCPDAGTEITELLREDDVYVTAADDAAGAESAVMEGREHGLVVIDTAAVRPGEAVGVAELARELAPLDLDAVYIAVPATMSTRAGVNLIEGFAALAPSGIVITHADETDHLGVAIELARDSGIPVAFVHEGLELDRALSVADPFMLARRLLP
jgi:flagellar biosynthesis GTPase FlhF